MDARVLELLERKRHGHRVVTIDRNATVHAAAGVIVANQVGSVVVTDGARVCGLLSEREFVHRVILEARDPTKTRVHEVMTEDVVAVTPQHQVEDCMKLMTRHRCRHLPVEQHGRLVGVVSIGDCVAHLSQKAVAENADLYAYIAGYYPS